MISIWLFFTFNTLNVQLLSGIKNTKTAQRSAGNVCVKQSTSSRYSIVLSLLWGLNVPSLCSLQLLSSACGHNGFDTRVLMNLISLMCLNLLSPKSLLLFNGVLQSYLISPLVLFQHAAPLWVYLQHDVPLNLWKTEGTLWLTDLCYHGVNRLGQKYSEQRYYCFSTLNSTIDCLIPIHIDPFLQPFHAKCFNLIFTPPRLCRILTNGAGCLYDS